ncbi:hypothetical protein MAR_006408 [Mya arenaria]|uniref:Uncharacterized protein n=1 Tax=Mya arenaria TaxID=6604 RepID=A0ABY7D8D2_MYAAR|nr:hypothetical protein MAR_006408 [Mya arenaria]
MMKRNVRICDKVVRRDMVQALRKKRPGMEEDIENVLLHQDNAQRTGPGTQSWSWMFSGSASWSKPPLHTPQTLRHLILRFSRPSKPSYAESDSTIWRVYVVTYRQ